MQNKFAVIAMIMVLMIGMTGLGAATYTSVTLEDKNSTTWVANETNDISAKIVYGNVGSDFVWHASGTAQLANKNYSLIYYADPWPGDNPGKLIGTMETDADGDFDATGSEFIGFDLPHADDDENGNASETNFCNFSNGFDDYTKCNGAKLWMVLSDDYTEPAMIAWNPENYLFETNLITYDYAVGTQAAGDGAVISIGDAHNDDTVPIMISNCMNVGSVDVTLTYNASLVTVTGVTNGEMDSMVSNTGVGHVRIGAFQMGSPGLGGEFKLVDVTFEPVGSVSCDTCDFTITVTTFKDATPAGVTMLYTTETGQYFSYLNGDVNSDGVVEIFDCMYLAKHIVGIAEFGTICEVASDVNGDGEVDMADVSRLAGCIVEIPDYCPLE